MTEIKCPICKGTKMHPRIKGVPCGACCNTGFSTNPYDQPWNATMVGRNVGEDLPEGLKVLGAGKLVPDHPGGPRIIGILVAWDNPRYEERLALDKQGLLYP